MKILSIILSLQLFASLAYTQNIRFSFQVTDNNNGTSTVDIYAQTTTGTETLLGYTTYFYSDNAETTLALFDDSPTTSTLGWGTANRSSINHQTENNPAVPITHTGFFFYQNFDNSFAGSVITTAPTLLLQLSFDHSIGTPASGEGFLGSANEVIGLQYSDETFTGHDIIVIGAQAAVLPVELTLFSVSNQNENALLHWRTASEINAAHFEVEHSRDAKHFAYVGQVAAAGNSQVEQRYDLLHKQPGSGTHYYRLRQVDRDGSFDYSNIQAITFESNTPAPTVFPNPATSVLNIQFEESAEIGQVQLINSTGQVVRVQSLEQGSYQTQLLLDQLSEGIYWIQMEVNGTVYSDKVVLSRAKD